MNIRGALRDQWHRHRLNQLWHQSNIYSIRRFHLSFVLIFWMHIREQVPLHAKIMVNRNSGKWLTFADLMTPIDLSNRLVQTLTGARFCLSPFWHTVCPFNSDPNVPRRVKRSLYHDKLTSFFVPGNPNAAKKVQPLSNINSLFNWPPFLRSSSSTISNESCSVFPSLIV